MHRELGRPVRILDYGAGKGRLLDIAEHELGQSLVTLLDYSAFDPSPKHAETCKSTIARIYGSSDGRYYSKKSSILETLAGKKFDAVILCNVLHEISPIEWRHEFDSIASIISPSGELLIVEDLLLPHGEHAHNEGFVIASQEAFRLLFAIQESETGVIRQVWTENPKMADRLICIGIRASQLTYVTSETVVNALSYISKHASQRIQEIRSDEELSYKNGLLHALYLHQFANSTFALKRVS
jgi:SAM-dependent methyltransferase